VFKVALTGSSGMIGRHMKALLKQNDVECLCVDRKQWNLEAWKTYEELDSIFEEAEAIFHFGATLPLSSKESFVNNKQIQKVFDANVRSCLNLADWAQKRDVPIVFLSGSTVYEDPHAFCIKESACQVKNGFGGFYGYSKLLAEKVFDHFIEEGLKMVVLRPSSVYGTGLAADKLISSYLSLASQNKVIEVDMPDNQINLVHAYDVSKAALLALKQKAWGTYNIAAANTSSIQELAELVVDICGSGKIVIKKQKNKPYFIRFDLDTSKAKKAFLFEPSVNLKKGLDLMYTQKELEC